MKNLPRELAERLVPHPQTCTEQYCTCTGWLIENRFRAEAVIREAMQKAQLQWTLAENKPKCLDNDVASETCLLWIVNDSGAHWRYDIGHYDFDGTFWNYGNTLWLGERV